MVRITVFPLVGGSLVTKSMEMWDQGHLRDGEGLYESRIQSVCQLEEGEVFVTGPDHKALFSPPSSRCHSNANLTKSNSWFPMVGLNQWR